MNTKLHAVSDAEGPPLSFFMIAGQVSDYTGAAARLDDLPKAQWLLGDRGYDADWFRDALEAKGIQPCIPGRRSRNEPVRYDKRRYRRRSRIEIMFGRLKGLASRRHSLRPMPHGLLLRHRTRGHGHLLAMTNEP
jgi:transposase